jgi:hypothetical protein
MTPAQSPGEAAIAALAGILDERVADRWREGGPSAAAAEMLGRPLDRRSRAALMAAFGSIEVLNDAMYEIEEAQADSPCLTGDCGHADDACPDAPHGVSCENTREYLEAIERIATGY